MLKLASTLTSYYLEANFKCAGNWPSDLTSSYLKANLKMTSINLEAKFKWPYYLTSSSIEAYLKFSKLTSKKIEAVEVMKVF